MQISLFALMILTVFLIQSTQGLLLCIEEVSLFQGKRGSTLGLYIHTTDISIFTSPLLRDDNDNNIAIDIHTF